MSDPVSKTLVGMTDLAWALLDRAVAEGGYKSRGEYLEWIVLCQFHSAADAQALWERRRQRGGRGGVIVVPDGCELPPEGS
jgi:hypothetical protein